MDLAIFGLLLSGPLCHLIPEFMEATHLGDDFPSGFDGPFTCSGTMRKGCRVVRREAAVGRMHCRKWLV